MKNSLRISYDGPQTDDKEDDGRISRDRQHASSRLDSPIVERRLVAVPAGSRTICIAGTPGRAMQYADDWSRNHRHDLSARHPCLRACRLSSSIRLRAASAEWRDAAWRGANPRRHGERSGGASVTWRRGS